MFTKYVFYIRAVGAIVINLNDRSGLNQKTGSFFITFFVRRMCRNRLKSSSIVQETALFVNYRPNVTVSVHFTIAFKSIHNKRKSSVFGGKNCGHVCVCVSVCVCVCVLKLQGPL